MIWSPATTAKPVVNIGRLKLFETSPSLLDISAGSESLSRHLEAADIFIEDPYMEKSLSQPWTQHDHVSDTILDTTRRSGSVVTFSSVVANRLSHVGGPGHWYHCLQAVFPSLIEAHDKIWGEDAATRLLEMDKNVFDDIFVVFNEAESVEKLNPFTRLMISLVVTCGRFRRVHFAHAPKAIVDDPRGVICFNEGFQVHFTADRETQSIHDLFVISAIPVDNRRKSLRTKDPPITMNFLLSVQLMAPRRQMFWFLTHRKLLYFKKAFAQTCDVPDSAPVWSEIERIEHLLKSLSTEEQNKMDFQYALPSSLPSSLNQDSIGHPDDIESVVNVENYDLRHDKSLLNPFRTGLPLSAAQVTVYNASMNPPTLNLLIYQRDRTRILKNFHEVARNFNYILPSPTSQERGRNATDPVAKFKPMPWNVHTLVHSEKLAPCDLVRRMQNTTAFVTIHGFQSTMLLFLPDNSVLAEIHPSLAYFPNHFGQFQLSFRQRFGLHRSFLGEESIPTNHLVQFAMSRLGISTAYCVGQKWCRQYAKTQDVIMSNAFVDRLARFLKSHFVIHQ